MDFPVEAIQIPPSNVLGTLKETSEAYDAIIMENRTIVSSAWPAANRALFFPIRVASPFLITKVAWLNGATVNGNVDVGVYDILGNQIVSLGSTAQATINAVQSGDIADTLLERSLYYIALASDSATATFFASAPIALLLRSFGVQEMAAAFPLPATATFANPSSAYIPSFSLHNSTVI